MDIAEEKIFSDRSFEMKADALEEVMMKALLMERKGFVELLILNGFSMSDFLTVRSLRELYNQGLQSWPHLLEQVRRMVGPRNSLHLRDVHKVLKYVLKTHRHPLYEHDVLPGWQRTTKIQKELAKNGAKAFEDPYFELFIWAVLMNKPLLRDFFWTKCGSPLVCCILAGAVYSTLAKIFRSKEAKKNSKILDNFLLS